jgi:uncharacterized protein
MKPNLAAGSVTIDLRGLGEGTHSVHVDAPGVVFQVDGDSEFLFRDARIEGTLTRNDTILRVRGVLQGTLESSCDRCLARFEHPVETELELGVVIGNEASGGEGAPESGEDEGVPVIHVPADAGALDLSDTLREAVLLEVPIKNLCREDCRGLCPRCGGNRNLDPCDCDPAPRDPRWGALRELSFPSDDQE